MTGYAEVIPGDPTAPLLPASFSPTIRELWRGGSNRNANCATSTGSAIYVHVPAANNALCVNSLEQRQERPIGPLAPAGASSLLLHVNAMRTSRPCGKRCVEVHVKTRVQLQVVFEHLDHVNVMVAFKVDLPEIVLIEEVIGNDQALIVVGEHDIVRASVHAQVDDSCLERMLGV